MKNTKVRAIVSVLVAIITFIVGYIVLNSMIAIGDICMGVIYVGAIIAGGCFWIGSKQ